MSRPYQARYSEDEVTAVVEGYEELTGLRSRSMIQVRLIDLDRALKVLMPNQYNAVLLLGVLGITTRQAGKILGVSHVTAWKRYIDGLEVMARYLNGG